MSLKVDVAVPNALHGTMPDSIVPMTAVLIDKPFSDPAWIYESKLDGVRAICFIRDNQARIMSRNEKEIGPRYPELENIAHSITAKQAILDGEIVALNEKGLPSFQLIQSRIGLQKKELIARLAKRVPVIYYIFDLLYCDGFDLMPAPLIDRKELLKKIFNTDKHIRFADHIDERGDRFFEEAEKIGLEGIIAKKKDSPYVQKRSNYWLKIKTMQRQEVVIGGYTDPRGTREYFGALVVGLYENDQLYYVGHVGGGFNRKLLKQIYDLMQPLKSAKCPFVEPPRTNEPVQWIKPTLVCEVKFAEWTNDCRLRQPIFLGLRDDKDPRDCIRERKHSVERELEKTS